MARWLRFYTNVHRHPKIQQLNNGEFRFWTELLCIASELNENGNLGTAQTIAKMVSKRARNCQQNLEKLAVLQLICCTDGRYSVYNWARKQYISDQSNQRVMSYRDRYSNVGGAVTVTAPDYRKKDRLQTQTVTSGAGALAPLANGELRAPARAQEDRMKHGERIPLANGGEQVFVAEDSEAWKAWTKFRGKRPPMDKNFGWYFPTEFPPGYKSDGKQEAKQS